MVKARLEAPGYICVDEEVKRGIAQRSEEILRYLRTHPKAADTVDGVVDWWLPSQRYEMARERVQQALDHLVARGLVTKTILANGKVVYASTAKKTES
jgi:Fe2+ or Zn2+ uptake regulation protein